MSVIVAKSTYCCPGTVVVPTTYCIPAVSIAETILTGNILNIDGVDVTKWRAVKWHVIVSTLSGSKTKGYEIYATHRNGTNPSYNQYAIVGDRLFDQVPDVIISGGDLTLQITNNEAEDIEVYVTRFAVPIVPNVVEILPIITLTNITTFVDSGDTNVVDWLPDNDLTASKWYVVVTDDAGRKTISQVFGISQSNSYLPNSTHYGWTGDISLDYDIGVNYNSMLGLGLQLLFTNNDTVPYRVDITRIPIHSILEDSPPSCSDNSGISIWYPTSIIIPAGNTLVVDNTVNLPGHQGVKWLIGCIESVNNNSTAFEVACTHVGLTTSYNVPYGFIGDYMDLVINTNIVGNNIELSITNNQANPVLVNMARVPVSL